jgi:hypothetical protein
MPIRAAGALVAGVLACSLVACSDDEPRSDDPEAGPDDVLVDAHPEAVTGTEMWVQLPTGRLVVTVGEPVTTIPASESLVHEDGAAQELTAGDGQVFLPVQLGWAHDQEPGRTWAFVATATALGSAELPGRGRCDATGLEGSGNAVLNGEPAATDLETINTPTTADCSFVSLSQAFPVPQDAGRHELTIKRTHPCRVDGERRTLQLTTRFPTGAEGPG